MLLSKVWLWSSSWPGGITWKAHPQPGAKEAAQQEFVLAQAVVWAMWREQKKQGPSSKVSSVTYKALGTLEQLFIC